MYCILLVSIFMLVVTFNHGEDEILTNHTSESAPCDIKKYPFVVSIYRKKKQEMFCGGSLIRTDWVLTAAHCLHANDPLNLFVVAGVTYIKDSGHFPGQVADGILIINHEKFISIEPSSIFDDIGLMKLGTNIELGRYHVALATLPSKGYTAQQKKAAAVGWANQNVTKSGDSKTTRHLKSTNVSIKTTAFCQSKWQEFLPSDLQLNGETQLCTLSPVTEVACKGDSGSPLVVGKTVIGIASAGQDSLQKSTPAIQTRVEGYLDWIDNKLISWKHYTRNTEGSIDRSIIGDEDYNSLDLTNRCDRVCRTAYLLIGILSLRFFIALVDCIWL